MYTAARSSVTAGFVLTGAGVLAVGPIAAQPPTVEIPVAPAAASAAANVAISMGGLAGFVDMLRNAENGAIDQGRTAIDNVAGQVTTAALNAADSTTAEIDNLANAAIGSLGPGAFATLIGAFRSTANNSVFGVEDVLTSVLVSTITDHAADAAITVNNDLADGLIAALGQGGQPAQALATLIGAFRDAENDAIFGLSATVNAATDSIVNSITDNVAFEITQTIDAIANAGIQIAGPGPVATFITLVQETEDGAVNQATSALDGALNAFGSGIATAAKQTTQVVDQIANTLINSLGGMAIVRGFARTASVTAGSVTAGSVTAGSVTAGSVTAGSVTAGSVTAGSVTAGSVATVPRAARQSLRAGNPVVSGMTTPVTGTTTAKIVATTPATGDHHAAKAVAKKPVAKKK